MTKRIDKLCGVKERAVEAAEGALAQARAATTVAELALAATEQAWQDAQARSAEARIMSDLDDVDARARTLRQAVQRAEVNVRTRKIEEERLLGAVSEARMELRRFEMWGERAEASARATTNRLARNAEDALAARNKRESSPPWCARRRTTTPRPRRGPWESRDREERKVPLPIISAPSSLPRTIQARPAG